jgi:hypothetical protein
MMMMIHLNTAYPPLSLSFPLVLKYQGCQIAKSNKKTNLVLTSFKKGQIHKGERSKQMPLLNLPLNQCFDQVKSNYA